MNNTLYEITDKYLKVLDNLEVDEETGEILNAEELDELSEPSKKKRSCRLLHQEFRSLYRRPESRRSQPGKAPQADRKANRLFEECPDRVSGCRRP